MKFPGGRVKVVGIPGWYVKIRKKNEDFQRGKCKQAENSEGVMIKKRGIHAGSNSKKFFSGKAQSILHTR